MTEQGLSQQEVSSDMTTTFNAMGSTVTVRILDPGDDAQRAIEAVREKFSTIERTCTRFDANSDLMVANARGRRWAQVAPECLDVLRRAHRAHTETGGIFDPRTLESLQTLGYDRSWERIEESTRVWPTPTRRVRMWHPSFDEARSRVRIGSRPVDLGGIGKGFAVTESMKILRGHGRSILVEAGGDLAVQGPGPNSAGWRVHVENPLGGEQPAAVWEITDVAVATSSIYRRQWQIEGRRAHHLIDPRTGMPAESGLASVTVVHPDAPTAEVWTKVGFLTGCADIRSVFDDVKLPAVWITDDGRVGYSKAATPLLTWKVSRVHA